MIDEITGKFKAKYAVSAGRNTSIILQLPTAKIGLRKPE
jgi:hypothetical protein